MRSITVSYESCRTQVRIGAGLLDQAGRLLAEVIPPGLRDVLVVSDETVAGLYSQRLLAGLTAAGLRGELAVVPPGDASKSLTRAAELYDRLAAGRFARDALVLALGGGMVSDLAGFVAATWMRGVAFAICSTTLESAVDACLGGKTGVNHASGKNLIGAFHHPALVLVDPASFTTLDDRDMRAGLAESIKHGAIADAAFLTWQREHREAILRRELPFLEELIERNLRIKAGFVTADERETRGPRAMLNFGHTIGHAVEAAMNYRLRHGECVAIGMAAAARISREMGLLSAADAEALIQTLAEFGLPTTLPEGLDPKQIIDATATDKKVAGSRVRYVLLEGWGRAALREGVTSEILHFVLQRPG
jgi:3-dehydroquinate synthase